MSDLYNNHAFSSQVVRHKKLPLYVTYEFDFYRCVKFEDSFYGRTVSQLHQGNLRKTDGRYSNLFPNEKISYWSDCAATARKEAKKWNPGNDLITFWSYDDATSTFPTLGIEEPLIIIDGIDIGFADILHKSENGIGLSQSERNTINDIMSEMPDCLAYCSHVQPKSTKSTNFMFFEKGFRKLALREVKLRLGNKDSCNSNTIVCADTCDYSPIIEAYGQCFKPIARVVDCSDYRETEEYTMRNAEYIKSIKRMQDAYGGDTQ